MKQLSQKSVGVAAKVWVRLLLATVLCVILFISMEVITLAMFGQEVGYTIQDANGRHDYYYQDGDVKQTAESLNVEPNAFSVIQLPPAGAKLVMGVISQVLMLILFCVFPYQILWELGNRDDTNVRYRDQRPDPLRGFRIGLLAMTPSFVCWLVLVVSKFAAWTKFVNIYHLVMCRSPLYRCGSCCCYCLRCCWFL